MLVSSVNHFLPVKLLGTLNVVLLAASILKPSVGVMLLVTFSMIVVIILKLPVPVSFIFSFQFKIS